MRGLVLALVPLLVLGACKSSNESKAGPAPAEDVYEVTLQGAATAAGVLALSQPAKVQVKVTDGESALDVLLALREQLESRGRVVLCVQDRGTGIYSLLVGGRVEVSSKGSNLGGIGGNASQVIQRRETVESTVRQYFRYQRQNDAAALRKVTTEAFYPEASRGLGKPAQLSKTGSPALGCRSASVVVETVDQGGEHQQTELRLLTEDNSTWLLEGARPLARWRGQPGVS